MIDHNRNLIRAARDLQTALERLAAGDRSPAVDEALDRAAARAERVLGAATARPAPGAADMLWRQSMAAVAKAAAE